MLRGGMLLVAAQSTGAEGARSSSAALVDAPQKVRKPYQITRPREKWTEAEHQQFVEALQVHGRCWAKIGEILGSKTSGQVRSHAQKYFNKLDKARKQPPTDEQDDANGGVGLKSKLRQPKLEVSESDVPGTAGVAEAVQEARPDDGADTPCDNAQLTSGIAQAIATQMANWAQAHVQAAAGVPVSEEQAKHDALTVEAVATAAAAAAAAAANAVIAAAGEAIQRRIQQQAARGMLPFLIHPLTSMGPLVQPPPPPPKQLPDSGTAPSQTGGDATTVVLAGTGTERLAGQGGTGATGGNGEWAQTDEPDVCKVPLTQSRPQQGPPSPTAVAASAALQQHLRDGVCVGQQHHPAVIAAVTSVEEQGGPQACGVPRPAAETRTNNGALVSRQRLATDSGMVPPFAAAARPAPRPPPPAVVVHVASDAEAARTRALQPSHASAAQGRRQQVNNMDGVGSRHVQSQHGSSDDPSGLGSAHLSRLAHSVLKAGLVLSAERPDVGHGEGPVSPTAQRHHHHPHSAFPSSLSSAAPPPPGVDVGGGRLVSFRDHPTSMQRFVSSTQQSCVMVLSRSHHGQTPLLAQLCDHAVIHPAGVPRSGVLNLCDQERADGSGSGPADGASGCEAAMDADGGLAAVAAAGNGFVAPQRQVCGGGTAFAANVTQPLPFSASVSKLLPGCEVVVGPGCAQSGRVPNAPAAAAGVEGSCSVPPVAPPALGHALGHGGGFADTIASLTALLAAAETGSGGAIAAQGGATAGRLPVVEKLPHRLGGVEVRDSGALASDLAGRQAAPWPGAGSRTEALSSGGVFCDLTAKLAALQALPMAVAAPPPGVVRGMSAAGVRKLQALLQLQTNGESATTFLHELAAMQQCAQQQQLLQQQQTQQQAAALAALVQLDQLYSTAPGGDTSRTAGGGGAPLPRDGVAVVEAAPAAALLNDITEEEVAQLEHAILVMQQATSMAGPLAALLRQPKWQHAMGAAAAVLTAANCEAARTPQGAALPPGVVGTLDQSRALLHGWPGAGLVHIASASQGSNNSPLPTQFGDSCGGDGGGGGELGGVLRALSQTQLLGNTLLRHLAQTNEDGLWSAPRNAAALQNSRVAADVAAATVLAGALPVAHSEAVGLEPYGGCQSAFLQPPAEHCSAAAAVATTQPTEGHKQHPLRPRRAVVKQPHHHHFRHHHHHRQPEVAGGAASNTEALLATCAQGVNGPAGYGHDHATMHGGGGTAAAAQQLQQQLAAAPKLHHRKRCHPSPMGRVVGGKEGSSSGVKSGCERPVEGAAVDELACAKVPRVMEAFVTEAEQQDTATSGGGGNIVLARATLPLASTGKVGGACAVAATAAGGAGCPACGSRGTCSQGQGEAGQDRSSNGSDEGSNEPGMASGSTPPPLDGGAPANTAVQPPSGVPGHPATADAQLANAAAAAAVQDGGGSGDVSERIVDASLHPDDVAPVGQAEQQGGACGLEAAAVMTGAGFVQASRNSGNVCRDRSGSCQDGDGRPTEAQFAAAALLHKRSHCAAFGRNGTGAAGEVDVELTLPPSSAGGVVRVAVEVTIGGPPASAKQQQPAIDDVREGNEALRPIKVMHTLPPADGSVVGRKAGGMTAVPTSRAFCSDRAYNDMDIDRDGDGGNQRGLRSGHGSSQPTEGGSLQHISRPGSGRGCSGTGDMCGQDGADRCGKRAGHAVGRDSALDADLMKHRRQGAVLQPTAARGAGNSYCGELPVGHEQQQEHAAAATAAAGRSQEQRQQQHRHFTHAARKGSKSVSALVEPVVQPAQEPASVCK